MPVPSLLARTDAWVAATRPGWLWIGQLGLVVLGIHLAAGALGDEVAHLLSGLPGLPGGYIGPAAQGLALAFELGLTGRAAWILLSSAGGPEPTFQDWWARRSVEAFVRPVFWATMALSGTWTLAMAVQDASPVGGSAVLALSWVIAALAFWRLGSTSLRRVIGGLFIPKRRTWGLLWAPALLLATALGVARGLPVIPWW